MNVKKLLLFVSVPLMVLLSFWLITKAFHLISEPSDMSVFLGFALFGFTLVVLVSFVVYLKNKYFNS